MSNTLERRLLRMVEVNGGQMQTYFCPVCGRDLPVLAGVVTHDSILHPDNMVFDDKPGENT